MATKFRWCEISTTPSEVRFKTLSKFLSAEGFDNEVEFIVAQPEEFPDVLARAQEEFDQIRLSGDHCQAVCQSSTRLPSMLLTLRSADAWMRSTGAKGDEWWPRNHLADGIGHAIAMTVTNLDFSGGVFVVGASEVSRAAVAALVKVGFSRFGIVDPDDELCENLIEELKSSYFNIQFSAIARHLVTQLPGIYSFAVNTLVEGRDDGVLAELFYFNFLKTNGIWMDLAPLPVNFQLEAEARTVGASVVPGSVSYALADVAWAKACLKVQSLDHMKLAKALEEAWVEASSAMPPSSGAPE